MDTSWLDEWWAGWLGADPATLRTGGVVVAEERDHVGVLAVGGAPLVYGPSRLLHMAGVTAWPEPPGDVDEALARIVAVLGPRLDQVLGPAWYAYASAETLHRPQPADRVRWLTATDADALGRLRAAVPEHEWDEAGVGEAGDQVGWFEDGRLLAVVDVGDWRGIPSVGVLTDPEARGRGLGRRVVAGAAAEALKGGAPYVQYRALRQNRASIALARGAGFAGYGWGVVVDVRP